MTSSVNYYKDVEIEIPQILKQLIF